MIYEMRQYECYPGKLQALQELMEKAALPTFKKHGMHLVGAWSAISGAQEGTLIYLLGFDSLNDRMKKWEDFHKDEWWLEQRNQLRQKSGGGPMVARQTNVFLNPASYSPIK